MNQRDTLLFSLVAANMAITTDQIFTKLFQGTNWQANGFVCRRISGAFNTACLGGIYNAISKPAGGILVAAAVSYANLTGAGKIVRIDAYYNAASFAALNGTDLQTAIPYLSLTTANGAALTADWYIYGQVLD